MKLSWLDYAALHWPYLLMFAIALVSFIYTCGFESGKRSILFAAAKADLEGKGVIRSEG